jgi:hypothetical protein
MWTHRRLDLAEELLDRSSVDVADKPSCCGVHDMEESCSWTASGSDAHSLGSMYCACM